MAAGTYVIFKHTLVLQQGGALFALFQQYQMQHWVHSRAQHPQRMLSLL
jgi:hypothetical protein